ncbi:hypothetical protein R0J90_17515, partial [Micrococcus sp. SIMBA_144]
LFDTMGLFRKLNEEQEALVDRWMDALQLSHLGELRLTQISLEEQRFCLLARAMQTYGKNKIKQWLEYCLNYSHE